MKKQTQPYLQSYTPYGIDITRSRNEPWLIFTRTFRCVHQLTGSISKRSNMAGGRVLDKCTPHKSKVAQPGMAIIINKDIELQGDGSNRD